MDNGVVLGMKAGTMQVALALSCYHDNQPPELGGKSQERSAGGRSGTREVCVLVFQVLYVSRHTQVIPVLSSDVST